MMSVRVGSLLVAAAVLLWGGAGCQKGEGAKTRPQTVSGTITVAPERPLSLFVAGASLICLVGLGALAARTGGAPPLVGAARVAFWGALAMALTAGVGWVFGAAV